MYSKITNPETGRKVNLFGKIGQQILKNYINVMNGGACKFQLHSCTSQPPGFSECCEGLTCQEVQTITQKHGKHAKIHKPIHIPGFKGVCYPLQKTSSLDWKLSP